MKSFNRGIASQRAGHGHAAAIAFYASIVLMNIAKGEIKSAMLKARDK